MEHCCGSAHLGRLLRCGREHFGVVESSQDTGLSCNGLPWLETGSPTGIAVTANHSGLCWYSTNKQCTGTQVPKHPLDVFYNELDPLSASPAAATRGVE
jgi:hypothetical protein